jgi:hypothetical protein
LGAVEILVVFGTFLSEPLSNFELAFIDFKFNAGFTLYFTLGVSTGFSLGVVEA